MGRPRFTVGVIGVLLNEDQKALIVEHVFHPRTPWGLPGGWVDRSEGLTQTLEREMKEELGLSVSVNTVLIVEIAKQHPYHIDVVFLCDSDTPVGKISSELLSYKWINLPEAPHLPNLHYRAIQQALELQVRN
jgi:8-oxo-dGTP diphosphatase